jgi:hypothetical protein
MKNIKWVEAYILSFLTSALDGVSGQLHAPAALPKGKKPPVPTEYGDWVGIKAGLDVFPFRDSNPWSFNP